MNNLVIRDDPLRLLERRVGDVLADHVPADDPNYDHNVRDVYCE
jgi:hypothetical protein